MGKTILGLALAALMTAGLGSAAWAEPLQSPASAVEALSAGCDYTYQELLACLTHAGCTEAQALAYAGEPVEAPEGTAVRYSLLHLTDYDGPDTQPVEALVLAALEYVPGQPAPRSILALRSPMALTVDGSAFEGEVFAALYSGRNFNYIVSGNPLPEESELHWTATGGWILPGGTGEGYSFRPGSFVPGEAASGEPDGDSAGQTAHLVSVSCSQSGELFFPTLEP